MYRGHHQHFAALAIAVVALLGCGSEDSPKLDRQASEKTQRRANPGPKKTDTSKYSCSDVRLSEIVLATKVKTTGVPCGEAVRVLRNGSGPFSCFLTGTSARCTDGVREITYEQG
jgi:hypothetical protein